MEKIITQGVIPIFNHSDIEVCRQVLKACFEGGLRVFEFTNRNANALEVFTELRKFAKSNYPKILVGAGSITDRELTIKYIEAGADFIVSPVIAEEMAEICLMKNIPWIPGCATPTEMVYATKLGAKLVKFFPADLLGGSDFVKAIRAPLPWLNIIPTGGVDTSEENLSKWFEAGVICVGIGSKLITKEIIEKRDYAKLAESIRETIEIIENIRHKTQSISIKTKKS